MFMTTLTRVHRRQAILYIPAVILLRFCLTCGLPLSFFFQAEDGIRDSSVTGVQTCALPICDYLTENEAGWRLFRQIITSETLMPNECKQLCAVTDTNLWRAQLLLKTHLGAALLYAVRKRNGVVGLPEVVEMEIRKHIIKAGEEAAAQVVDGLETIKTLMGECPVYDPPSAAAFEQAVGRRLGEMKDFLVRVAFTIDHARAALDMVNRAVAPNNPNNQQFKDSAIWQALLELSKTYDVVFSTKDKGFFKSGEPKNGLADNLLEDCRRVGGNIEVYYDLRPCLEAGQKEVPALDRNKLAAMIYDHLRVHLTEMTVNRGCALASIIASSISPFATESLNLLAIIFELTYRLSDVAPLEGTVRNDSTVRVAGDCSYNEASEAMEDMRIDVEEFKWTDAEGKTA